MALFADAGLPMISMFLPAAWLAIIPIVLIEAVVGVRVAKLSFRRAAYAAAIANLFSTLLGIPLAWLALAVIEVLYFGTAKGLDSFSAKVYAVTVQSPWLIPYENDLVWMVPIAVVVLAVPLWLVSVLAEYAVARVTTRSVEPAALWRWMWKSNALSYAFLVSLIFLMLLLPLGDWLYRLLTPVTDWLAEVAFRLCKLLALTW